MTPDEQGTAPKSGPHDYGYPATSPHQDTAVVQESLEDYRRTFAEQARDTGMQAAEATDPEWADRVLEFIYVQDAGTVLDADIVRREFGSSPAVGSVFRRASSAGLIRCVGITTSTAVSRHRGITRRWVRN